MVTESASLLANSVFTINENVIISTEEFSSLTANTFFKTDDTVIVSEKVQTEIIANALVDSEILVVVIKTIAAEVTTKAILKSEEIVVIPTEESGTVKVRGTPRVDENVTEAAVTKKPGGGFTRRRREITHTEEINIKIPQEKIVRKNFTAIIPFVADQSQIFRIEAPGIVEQKHQLEFSAAQNGKYNHSADIIIPAIKEKTSQTKINLPGRVSDSQAVDLQWNRKKLKTLIALI